MSCCRCGHRVVGGVRVHVRGCSRMLDGFCACTLRLCAGCAPVPQVLSPLVRQVCEANREHRAWVDMLEAS